MWNKATKVLQVYKTAKSIPSFVSGFFNCQPTGCMQIMTGYVAAPSSYFYTAPHIAQLQKQLEAELPFPPPASVPCPNPREWVSVAQKAEWVWILVG